MSTAASDFNLEKISMKELGELIRGTIETGGNMFIAGRRGTGKTVCTKATIKEMGLQEVYTNLSMVDRVDLGGYPDLMSAKSKDDEFVSYRLPSYLKPLFQGDKQCVWALDEIDKLQDHSLTAPLLEITQFHTLNGRPIPNLKACIMTGNLISEGSQRPSLPLLDRAEKYLVEANTTHWLDWACKEGSIHPSITAFINDHGNDLFGEVDCGDLYADCSPRGWENSSKIVNYGEKHRWSPQVLTHKVAGCIGKKVGIKYASYFSHYTILLPIVQQILEGKDIKGFDALEPSKQCVACMIVCSRVARILDELKDKKKKRGDLPKEVDMVGKFMAKVDPELALISTRAQIGLDRTVEHDIDSHPIWGGILTELAKRLRS
jgi:hypothetical protein